MISFSLRSLSTAIGAVTILGVTACAPQQSARPAAAAPASQMSLGAPPASTAAPASASGSMSGMQGHDMSNMRGMQGHNMSGMNMQQMMAHCAQMRQQGSQGHNMPGMNMQQMMAQCAEMDRAHGAAPRR